MLKLNRKVLCLDWDKRSLRIVVARTARGRAALEDAHAHRLPEDVNADDPQQMGAFIQATLRRHHLHHAHVVVDVPRERAVINRLKLPPTPENEVAAAVRFQAMKELPFPLEQAALDYVIMRRDDAGLAVEVLLAAVTTETLDRVRATCAAAGLTPTRIGLRPYANLISVQRTREMLDRRVLFVDVGPGATEIDIMHGATLAFARSANVNVPVSTEPPGTREDSRVISLRAVDQRRELDEESTAAVNELLVETTRTLQAFRATETDTTIDSVIVAGGTGVEVEFAERLESRLGLSVDLFDPTEALEVAAEEAPKLRSFSAALGLAWGTSVEGALALDFLNPKRPVSRHETLRKRARVGMLMATMVVLAVFVIVFREYDKKRSRAVALEAINRDLKADVAELKAIGHRVEEAREWAIEALWPEELLSVTELALEEGDRPGERIVFQEVQFDTLSRTPGVTLRNVHTQDWQVPTAFVNRLNDLRTPDGTRLYDAAQTTWTEIPDALKYHGKTDIRIVLREIVRLREAVEKRAKERRQEEKKYGIKRGAGA